MVNAAIITARDGNDDGYYKEGMAIAILILLMMMMMVVVAVVGMMMMMMMTIFLTRLARNVSSDFMNGVDK